jgi:hypothetical protein
MAKRKYVKMGETPVRFKCTKTLCGWEGTHEEKEGKDDDGWTTLICPECGNEEFYGLLE